MNLADIIVLAVVQGLTEFLPVSSSGHLVVANALLEALGKPPAQDLLEVNIMLHIGTLMAIVVFYFREVCRLLGSDRRLIPLLLVGTIPAAIVGLPLKEFAAESLESVLLAGLMFPVTAMLLLWATWHGGGQTSYRDVTYAQTLRIGTLQALALLPGVSRSGATIAAGLSCGLDRESAGTYAFLLAIPAIGGAGLIETLKLFRDTSQAGMSSGTPPANLAIGAAVAMLVGLVSLSWLVRWIRAGRLAMFAWYLIPLGVAVVVWQLWR